MMRNLKESPSQTAGPYVHIGCVPQTAGLEARGMGSQLGGTPVSGDLHSQVTFDLSVLDGAGDLVKDALIEIWHAGPDGQFGTTKDTAHWGRQATDLDTGHAVFETAIPAATHDQAPHILVWIVARGINLGLTTRLYFPDDDNSQDPIFALAGTRADTMVVTKTDAGYSHVIHLQGPNETVFFDV